MHIVFEYQEKEEKKMRENFET